MKLQSPICSSTVFSDSPSPESVSAPPCFSSPVSSASNLLHHLHRPPQSLPLRASPFFYNRHSPPFSSPRIASPPMLLCFCSRRRRPLFSSKSSRRKPSLLHSSSRSFNLRSLLQDAQKPSPFISICSNHDAVSQPRREPQQPPESSSRATGIEIQLLDPVQRLRPASRPAQTRPSCCPSPTVFRPFLLLKSEADTSPA